MKITTKMRAHAVSKLGVPADANDEAVKSAVLAAIGSGSMSPGEYADLQKEEVALTIEERVAKAMAPMLDQMKAFRTGSAEVPAGAGAAVVTDPAGNAVKGGDAEDLFTKAAKAASVQGAGTVRVKKASEFYNHTKGMAVRRSKAGLETPATLYMGSPGSPNSGFDKHFDTTSQREYAMIGAWLKFMLRGSGMPGWKMSEHDVQLCEEALHEHTFCGQFSDDDPISSERMLKDHQRHTLKQSLEAIRTKAVLNDGTSGGQEAVPQFFDDAVIMTPLLYGELFPYVQVIPMARGNAVDGFSIGTPTFVSTASGTAVTPFTTTSFVGDYAVPIFPATCAIEWGLDFESDTVANFGKAVTEQIGYEAQRWLDEQIAIGDGTTEPQGIFVATNTNVPGVGTHTFSSMTYADVVNLAFGINKAGRNAFGGQTTRFVMSDVQYRNLMNIVTGVTGDTRPIFGMNLKDYMLGDYAVAIQNNISNGNLALCNLRGYRLYRRQGIEFTNVRDGRTLALANSAMQMARMRWGGKMTIPTSFTAEMTL